MVEFKTVKYETLEISISRTYSDRTYTGGNSINSDLQIKFIYSVGISSRIQDNYEISIHFFLIWPIQLIITRNQRLSIFRHFQVHHRHRMNHLLQSVHILFRLFKGDRSAVQFKFHSKDKNQNLLERRRNAKLSIN